MAVAMVDGWPRGFDSPSAHWRGPERITVWFLSANSALVPVVFSPFRFHIVGYGLFCIAKFSQYELNEVSPVATYYRSVFYVCAVAQRLLLGYFRFYCSCHRLVRRPRPISP